MSKIVRKIHPGDEHHSTDIKITFGMLKKFCQSVKTDLEDVFENDSYFVPGVMLIAMFRHLVKKLSNENTKFPFEKLKSFYGHNGGTKEGRLYIEKEVVVVYKIQFTCKMEGKSQYIIEICTKEEDKIVLQGIFSFI